MKLIKIVFVLHSLPLKPLLAGLFLDDELPNLTRHYIVALHLETFIFMYTYKKRKTSSYTSPPFYCLPYALVGLVVVGAGRFNRSHLPFCLRRHF